MEKSKPLLLIVIISFLISCGNHNSYQKLVDESLPWSVRLADSFLLTHPGAVTYDSVMTKKKWNYEQGVMLEALQKVYKKSGDKKYFNFIKANIDQYVDSSGNIKTYKYSDFNLDNINPGRALLFLFQETGEEKYKVAAEKLRAQLQNQPRTKAGGFWHKKRYPFQMWLDGIYMASPFYALYIRNIEKGKNFDDVILQVVTVYEKTVDKKNGLLLHAWNENKEQRWADPVSGKSPNVWGRAMGWYMMALVDILEIIPEEYNGRENLLAILQKTSEALLKYRDPASGLWYQLIEKPDITGNYLEASCAAMFDYAFAKGARLGYLDSEYSEISRDIFKKIIQYHVRIAQNGFVILDHTCAGAGLGGKPYRDGSDEYYLGVPQRTNDFKGFGPLIFAAVELEY